MAGEKLMFDDDCVSEFFALLIASARAEDPIATIPENVVEIAKRHAPDLPIPLPADMSVVDKLSRQQLFLELRKEHERRSPDDNWLAALIEGARKHPTFIARIALYGHGSWLRESAETRVGSCLVKIAEKEKTV